MAMRPKGSWQTPRRPVAGASVSGCAWSQPSQSMRARKDVQFDLGGLANKNNQRYALIWARPCGFCTDNHSRDLTDSVFVAPA